jgi:hypothetical protein
VERSSIGGALMIVGSSHWWLVCWHGKMSHRLPAAVIRSHTAGPWLA